MIYIPETRVIIEQKSLGKALDQKNRNSGDVDITPFEQADRKDLALSGSKGWCAVPWQSPPPVLDAALVLIQI